MHTNQEQFDAVPAFDPVKVSFAKGGMVFGSNEPAPVSRRVEWTCPLHPHLVRDGPGACPISGMPLEPQTVERPTPGLVHMRRQFYLSAALTLPLLFWSGSVLFLGPPAGHEISFRGMSWLLLATPVILGGGLPFLRRGLASVRNHSLDVATLIALSTAAAYVFSAFAVAFPLLLPHGPSGRGSVPPHFQTAAVSAALVLLGQALELKSRRSAHRSLGSHTPGACPDEQGSA